MIAKYIFVALCAALALQTQSTLAAKKIESAEDLYRMLTFGIQTDETLSPQAEETVNTLLRHLKFVLVDNQSSQYIRLLSTNIREILTNEVGAKNVKNIITTMSYFLRNEQSAMIIAMICDTVVNHVVTDSALPLVLDSFSVQFKNVMCEPNAQATTQAFIDGTNLLLDNLTPAQITNAIRRLKTIVNIMKATFGRAAPPTPKTPVTPIKTPSPAQLTRSSSSNGAAAEVPIQTRDLSSAYKPPMTMEDALKCISKNESNINIDVMSKT